MKAKFNKLDRSKLSKEVNSILDKIKKATDNFKKEDKWNPFISFFICFGLFQLQKNYACVAEFLCNFQRI